MSNFIKSIYAGLLLCALQLGHFSSVEAEGSLCLDTGYRWDRVDTHDRYNDAEDVFAAVVSGKIAFKDIQSYQLGFQGDWRDPCFGLYLKGDFHYGWVLSGDYDLNSALWADIDRGHTIDGSGALGYPINLGCCLQVIPLVGYSYDQVYLKLSHSRANPLFYANDIDKASSRTSFYGPWIGADLLFNTCLCDRYDLDFIAGYEYHYGWSKYKWDQPLASPDNGDFSYRTHLKNMQGQVFRLQSNYQLCDCWVVGLKLQYTFWESTHYNHTKVPGPTITGQSPVFFQTNSHLTWHSFLAALSVGYTF
jgi:hypothetical protein